MSTPFTGLSPGNQGPILKDTPNFGLGSRQLLTICSQLPLFGGRPSGKKPTQNDRAQAPSSLGKAATARPELPNEPKEISQAYFEIAVFSVANCALKLAAVTFSKASSSKS